MGFGTFFIGYFFLVNISYFEYTDVVSAMIMLLGLYNLSKFNRGFKIGFAFSSTFTIFSFAEFIVTVVKLFDPSFLGKIDAVYFSIPRYALIFGITVSMLIGINDLAREVEAYTLARKAGRTIPWCAIYLVMAICEISEVGKLLGVAVPYVYLSVLLGHLALVAVVLTIVYKAYATICMPEDLNKEPKKSKFDFINKLNDRAEKKNLEYADYKIKKGLEQERKKSSKNKK